MGEQDRSGGAADAGEDAADEFAEAGLCGFHFGFGLAVGFFPSGSESGGLFAHEFEGGFVDLELAKLGAAGFLLGEGEVDAEGLGLAAEGFDFGFESFLAGGLDGELGVEVGAEVTRFGFEAGDFPVGVATCGESGFPDQGGEDKAGCEAPCEGVFEYFFHLGSGVFRCWFILGVRWGGGSALRVLECGEDAGGEVGGIFGVEDEGDAGVGCSGSVEYGFESLFLAETFGDFDDAVEGFSHGEDHFLVDEFGLFGAEGFEFLLHRLGLLAFDFVIAREFEGGFLVERGALVLKLGLNGLEFGDDAAELVRAWVEKERVLFGFDVLLDGEGGWELAVDGFDIDQREAWLGLRNGKCCGER